MLTSPSLHDSRLPLRIQSNVDKLRSTIPYPREAIPKTHLPTWPELPLHTKLPNVPAPPGAIIFSRGRIASSVYSYVKLGRNFGRNLVVVHNEIIIKSPVVTPQAEKLYTSGSVAHATSAG